MMMNRLCALAFLLCLHATAQTNISDKFALGTDGKPIYSSLKISWPNFTSAQGQATIAGTVQITVASDGSFSLALPPGDLSKPSFSYTVQEYAVSGQLAATVQWFVPTTSTTLTLNQVKVGTQANSSGAAAVGMSQLNCANCTAGDIPAFNGSSFAPVSVKAFDAAGAAASVQTSSIQKSANLNDIANKAAALANLGGVTAQQAKAVAPVQTVAGKSGNIVLTHSDVSGLSQSAVIDTTDAGNIMRGTLDATHLPSVAARTDLPVTFAQSVTAPQLTGVLQAGQFASTVGNNGISNAISSLLNQSGLIHVEPTYPTSEIPQGVGDNKDNLGLPFGPGVEVKDERAGQSSDYCSDPTQFFSSFKACHYNLVTFAQPNKNGTHFHASYNQTRFLNGGNNLQAYTGPWQGYAWPSGRAKSAFSSDYQRDRKFTSGQYTTHTNTVGCYGMGDCIGMGFYITTDGGPLSDGDEGVHTWDIQVGEDSSVYSGTITSDASIGGTALVTAPVTGAGTQGEGRYLIRTNAGTTSGNLSGAVNPVEPDGVTDCTTATTYTAASCLPGQLVSSGSGWNASLFLGLTTALVAPSTNQPPVPGVQTVTVVPMSGFSLTAATVGAYVCVTDSNYTETTVITSIDITSGALTAFFNRPHSIGALVAVGGTCGTYIEIGAYRVTSGTSVVNGNKIGTVPVRHVFPLAGSPDASHTYVYNRDYGIQNGFPTPKWGVNTCLNVANASRANNAVTLTLTTPTPWIWDGSTLNISGISDPSFNGTYKAFQAQSLATSPAILTYTQTGQSDNSGTGGQACFTNNAFTIYQGAEVMSVYNSATNQVDGSFTLAPNNAQWSTGDTVEEEHGFNQNIPWRNGYTPSWLVSHFQPSDRPTGEGIGYGGVVDGWTAGWMVSNVAPVNTLQGHGGFLAAPRGFELTGVFGTGYGSQYAPEIDINYPAEFTGDAGALLWAGCPQRGCSAHNSAYPVFSGKGNNGWSRLMFDPSNQGFSLSNPYGRGWMSGNNIPIGGILSTAALATQTGSGNAIIASPNAIAGTDGTANQNSNLIELCGSYGTGTAAANACSTEYLSVGTGVTPNITGTDKPPTLGGSTVKDFSSWGSVKVAGLTLVNGFQGVPISPVTTAVSGANSNSNTLSESVSYWSTSAAPVTASFNWTAQLSSATSNSPNIIERGACANAPASCIVGLDTTSKVQLPASVTVGGSNLNLPLSGTTGTIGGSALAVGACASGTATVTGATAGMGVVLGTYPGDSFRAAGYVSATNTVTVKICAYVAATPTAQTYTIRVIP
jgi:hypothetical protein